MKYIITLLLLLTACTNTENSVRAKVKRERSKNAITVFYTNDINGHIEKTEESGMGLATIKDIINSNDTYPKLYLDGGNTLHGSLIVNQDQGLSMVKLLNQSGLDAMTLGNHDFNYGLERLQELEAYMDFPLLSSNIRYKNSDLLVFQDYLVKKVGNIKVGIFGLTNPQVEEMINPKHIEDIYFDDPISNANRVISDLKGLGVDYIIALAHLGLDHSIKPEYSSTYLAKETKGIDLILNAHKHNYIFDGLKVKGTYVVQNMEFTKTFSQIDINNHLINNETSIKTYYFFDEGLNEDKSTLQSIENLKKGKKDIAQFLVATSPVELNGAREFVGTEETNLGNLLADSILWRTGAQVSFINSGSIKNSIHAGDVTIRDVYNALPFDDDLVILELSGQEIIDILEHSFSNYPTPNEGFLQIAGMRVVFDRNNESGERIVQVRLNSGQLLMPNVIYKVATNSFLAKGGDGYRSLKDKDTEETKFKLIGTFVQYLNYIDEESIGRDERIKRIK